jgi:hypothetical protein
VINQEFAYSCGERGGGGGERENRKKQQSEKRRRREGARGRAYFGSDSGNIDMARELTKRDKRTEGR